MKAAVYNIIKGKLELSELPIPKPQNADEVLMSARAIAIKNFDILKAKGKHYSSEQQNTEKFKVIGSDGIGILDNGMCVYAVGIDGMAAEKVLVRKDMTVSVPETLNNVTAAAIPNAVMGSAMALRFRAEMQEGNTVLINGATGITGKMAIQLARLYGAGKIIATGRNENYFDELKRLGADDFISLSQSDEQIASQLKGLHISTPIDCVIDYLWGHSAEIILSALSGHGNFTHKTRFVSVGSIGGSTINLASSILRGTDISLSGSGLGSWTKEQVAILFSEILPEVFDLAAKGDLEIETSTIQLADIEKLNDLSANLGGKRLVITI